MTLSRLIIAELRRLGGDSAAAAALAQTDDGARTISFGGVDGQPGARIEFFDQDRYSITMRSLSVGAGSLPPIDPRADDAGAQRDARLSSLANAIIARLGYLEEPLAIVERDAAEGSAQIRSLPPLIEEGCLSYWEVVLAMGAQPAATITRYSWSPEQPEREPIPYPATFALIGRLADSLVAALESLDV